MIARVIYFVYYIICSALFHCAAQTCTNFTGLIVDSTHKPLSHVILEAESQNQKWYDISKANGQFDLQVCFDSSNPFHRIAIGISLIGYEKKMVSIESSFSKYDLGSIVLSPSLTILKEVFVINKPIEQRGDTTSFKLGSYQNKLDENLEDVLKKMPGFDINTNGEITYKNKPINNILIEGDELTKNYKVVSRNLSPDAIDKVEMIDKWNANPVLKGMTNPDGQVMNLKLKNPNRIISFGRVKAGAGIEDKATVTGNMFMLNKKLKSMLIGNTNNIGLNPYSEITVDQNFSPNRDYEFDRSLVPTVISENKLFNRPLLNANQGNDLFNKSRLGLFNNSYNITPSTNIKLYLNCNADNIQQNINSEVINLINPSLSYKESISKKFAPGHFDCYLQYAHTQEKSRLLMSALCVTDRYNEGQFISSINNFKSNLHSIYAKYGIGVFYTHRMDSNMAFEFSGQYLHDSKNQNYLISDQAYRTLDSLYTTDQQNQVSSSKVDYIKAETKLFVTRKRFRTVLRLTDIYFSANFGSTLSIIDSGLGTLTPPNFNNANTIWNNRVIFSYQVGYRMGRLSFIADASGVFSHTYWQQHTMETNSITNEIIFIPQINTSYVVNKQNTFNAFITMNANYAPLNTQATNPVLNAYRSVNNYLLFSGNLRNTVYSINYTYSNFEQGTSFILGASRYQISKSPVQNILFTKDFDYYTIRYINTHQAFDNLYANFDQYIVPLRTAFSIKNNLSWITNPVEINGQPSSSKFLTYNATLSVRPRFSSQVNATAGITYQTTKDIQFGKSTFQINPFIDILTVYNKKISLGGRLNYYYSNYYPNRRDYIFVDMYAWYNILPGKLDIKLSILNTLNTHNIHSGIKNAYMERSTATAILPRFCLFEVIYKL